jgi:hypothetical protein
MSFFLHCAIARTTDEAEAEAMLAVARALPVTRAQPITAPFAGIVAGYDPGERREHAYAAALASGASEEDASEASCSAEENGLDPLIRAFPHVRFAVIDVECVGDLCLVGGTLVGPGERVSVARSGSGHQQLLAALGAVDPPWYFAPFTRGFFDHGEAAPGPPRRETRCTVEGSLGDVVLTAVLLLRPPWQIHSVSERHAILGYGDDDLTLSLNVKGDLVALGVASHLDVDATVQAITELVDTLCGHGELRATDLDGTVLRRWSV